MYAMYYKGICVRLDTMWCFGSFCTVKSSPRGKAPNKPISIDCTWARLKNVRGERSKWRWKQKKEQLAWVYTAKHYGGTCCSTTENI